MTYGRIYGEVSEMDERDLEYIRKDLTEIFSILKKSGIKFDYDVVLRVMTSDVSLNEFIQVLADNEFLPELISVEMMMPTSELDKNLEALDMVWDFTDGDFEESTSLVTEDLDSECEDFLNGFQKRLGMR